MRRALTLGAVAGVVSGNAGSLKDQFEEFKEKFNKEYSSLEEEAHRFKIFTENVLHISKMKAVDQGTATYSHLSPLADLSTAEFQKLNTLKVTEKDLESHERMALSVVQATTPDSYDWRAKGGVVEVKNQGQCGSCWSFATAASIEGANFVKNGELISLSESELVDCDTNDNGCGGGLPSNAYKFLLDHKMGLEKESAYPYKPIGGKCSAEPSLEKVFLSSWLQVSTDETEIAAALVKYGPLAIGINASPMQFYSGGISDPWDFMCNPSALDHGVTLVAYGTENGTPWWAIKNSWGNAWGEKGYYRIVRGKGKCGLNRMVTAAIAAPKSGTEVFI